MHAEGSGRILPAILSLAICLAFFGCKDVADVTEAGQTGHDAVVTGEVTGIVDLVPVDGGVTIDLEDDRGEKVVLLLESIFTSPLPSEERLRIHTEVYAVVTKLEVGDRVEAEGIDLGTGILLTKLTKLDG